MTEINPDKIKLDEEMSSRDLDPSPVDLLEKVKKEGRSWDELSEQYGVDNPDPPWRITLESTCDMLANGYMAPFNVCMTEDDRDPDKKLDAVERRWEEDQLVKERYSDVPFPERTLLALAHSMIRRGLIDEEELARRMEEVDRRLNMV